MKAGGKTRASSGASCVSTLPIAIPVLLIIVFLVVQRESIFGSSAPTSATVKTSTAAKAAAISRSDSVQHVVDEGLTGLEHVHAHAEANDIPYNEVHQTFVHIVMTMPGGDISCGSAAAAEVPSLLMYIGIGKALDQHCAHIPGGITHSLMPTADGVARLNKLSSEVAAWAKADGYCGNLGFVHKDMTAFYTCDGVSDSIKVPQLCCTADGTTSTARRLI
ncbi:hypothetical protein FOA52_004412 [Chlamydomonas sp. UWO 241]|nr:hypothetical protein FOA52_004412 [Chlamydomonas sp. UWO 241]